jgi:hypothetical protein
MARALVVVLILGIGLDAYIFDGKYAKAFVDMARAILLYFGVSAP